MLVYSLPKFCLDPGQSLAAGRPITFESLQAVFTYLPRFGKTVKRNKPLTTIRMRAENERVRMTRKEKKRDEKKENGKREERKRKIATSRHIPTRVQETCYSL